MLKVVKFAHGWVKLSFACIQLKDFWRWCLVPRYSHFGAKLLLNAKIFLRHHLASWCWFFCIDAFGRFKQVRLRRKTWLVSYVHTVCKIMMHSDFLRNGHVFIERITCSSFIIIYLVLECFHHSVSWLFWNSRYVVKIRPQIDKFTRINFFRG